MDHVKRITLRHMGAKKRQQAERFRRYAPLVVAAVLNVGEPWENVGLESRRARAAGRLRAVEKHDVSPRTFTRCEEEAFTDIAMQIADMAAAWKVAIPSRANELTDADRQLRKHLGNFIDTVKEENSSEGDLLLSRGLLPVPWETVTADFGNTAGELAFRFAGMQNPQMVLLGDAGSGKTTMVTLVITELHGLRERAQSFVDPIPVRLSIATWNPYEANIRDWMLTRLAEEYPKLKTMLAETSKEGLSDRLIERWILPVLDGFDEMKESVRKMALSDLAIFFRRRPVILTSRTVQFGELKEASGFLPGSIRAHMRPVIAEDALGYLTRAAPQSDPAAWEEIFDNPPAEITEILKSPLMIWLLADIYSTKDIDPRSELLEVQSKPLRSRLLQSLVPSAFTRLNGADKGKQRRSAVNPREAVDAFTWLASRLDRHGFSAISWWQIENLAPLLGITLGLAAVTGFAWGLVAGKAIISIIPSVALVLGSFFGFGCGRGYSNARKKGMTENGRNAFGDSTAGVDPGWGTQLYRLGTALLGATVFIVSSQITASAVPRTVLGRHLRLLSLAEELRIAATVGVVSALTCIAAIIVGSLTGWYLRTDKNRDASLGGAMAGTARKAMRRDRVNGLLISIPGVITCSFAMYLIFYQFPLQERMLASAAAVIAAIPGMFVQTAWPRYRIAHLWLTLLNRIPLRFIAFIEDAHDVGILRQTGLSYDFRHELLRESLIDQARNPSSYQIAL